MWPHGSGTISSSPAWVSAVGGSQTDPLPGVEPVENAAEAVEILVTQRGRDVGAGCSWPTFELLEQRLDTLLRCLRPRRQP